MVQANWQHQHGGSAKAETLCNQILAREPGHVHALNLLGLIMQAGGRHKAAAKTFERAVASDPANAACRYNLANSYQALGRVSEAAEHFTKAIAFGAHQNNTEQLVLQSPVIAACIDVIETQRPATTATTPIFSRAIWQGLASDIFLRCALSSVLIRSVEIERVLTLMRAALLDFAYSHFSNAAAFDTDLVPLFTSVALQCFINEHVFAQSDEETRQSHWLRDLLSRKLAAGDDIVPPLLAAVAAYFPLHTLPQARALAERASEISADLIRQALREPLQEIEDRRSIPALTVVDDRVSRQVMQQYEQNPYPRWTVEPFAALAADGDISPASEAADASSAGADILIAGCGSGQHAYEIAWRFPQARVLAIDISLPSLAYARRKTREAGLNNIEYAKADILELAALGRSFDRIEAVGVLHHLADPEHGWRILLSLLRSQGEMRVGLYSEAARRSIAGVRAFIAARAYQATAPDIRQCRQDVLRGYQERGWLKVIESADFYSMSGCRDLLFNVVEHRFTIPRIKAFLDRQNLSFLGFATEPWVAKKFQEQYGEAACTDLDRWDAFEASHPQSFRYMYVFTTRKA